MDEARQRAFRRILYSAMLDFRAHTPTHAYAQWAWCKPWLWWRTWRRLVQVQETANWLHNLAFFAADDFDGFDEEWFWREHRRLLTQFPELEPRMGPYRSEFEYDWTRGGNLARARAWGGQSVT